MRIFFEALGVIRAPILIALFGTLILSMPKQSIELFRSVWFDTENINAYPIALQFCGLIFVSLALLTSSSALIIQSKNTFRANALIQYRDAVHGVSAILVVLPWSTMWYTVAVPYLNRFSQLETAGSDLVLKFGIPIATASLIYYIFSKPTIRGLPFFKRLFTQPKWVSQISICLGILITATLTATLTIALLAKNPDIAQLAGTVLLFSLFLCLLLSFLSILTHVYDRYGLPIVTGLLAAALAFAIFELNDNHHIRTLPGVNAPKPVAQAFRHWLSARPDLESYRNTSYPVYIVSSEGGGMYAAAHSALTLAAIQERCPSFASHTFAISGVSGGSLGAAVFNSIVNAADRNNQQQATKEGCKPNSEVLDDRPLTDAVRVFFENDFLSPMVGASLFPDFFQRFWPKPIGMLDRARALEMSFENAWLKTVRKFDFLDNASSFRKPFDEHWHPLSSSPALMLNSTLVHYGDRVIIAPFLMKEGFVFSDSKVDLLNIGVRLPLSSAVGISARFPIVTPKASYRSSITDILYQLGDGGYFENSGVRTATDLVRLLRKSFPFNSISQTEDQCKQGNSASSHFCNKGWLENARCSRSNLATVSLVDNSKIRACFRFLTIRSENSKPSHGYSGELFAPVATMLATRQARGRSDYLLQEALFCGGSSCGGGSNAKTPHIYVKYLNPTELDLPLGWYISSRRLRLIERSISFDRDCLPYDETRASTQRPWVEIRNEETACITARIRNDLLR